MLQNRHIQVETDLKSQMALIKAVIKWLFYRKDKYVGPSWFSAYK